MGKIEVWKELGTGNCTSSIEKEKEGGGGGGGEAKDRERKAPSHHPFSLWFYRIPPTPHPSPPTARYLSLCVVQSLSLLSLSPSNCERQQAHFFSTVCLQTPSLLSSAFFLGLFAPIWSGLVPVRPTMFIDRQSLWTTRAPSLPHYRADQVPGHCLNCTDSLLQVGF